MGISGIVNIYPPVTSLFFLDRDIGSLSLDFAEENFGKKKAALVVSHNSIFFRAHYQQNFQ